MALRECSKGLHTSGFEIQGNEMETDNKFKCLNKNLYFIGDGAGKAGNIVVAAATGLVAARDIIDRIKEGK